MKVRMLILIALVALTGCNKPVQEQLPAPENVAGRHLLTDPIVTVIDMDSIIYLPDDYGKDPAKKWPLVLFLHGVGERGSDVNRVEATGLPKLAADGRKFDFILLAPQCPNGQFWPMATDSLIALLNNVEGKYTIDKNRVYLTGLSMGGFGSWSLACSYPDHFAAVAPICGGGMPFMANALKDVPVWAFHGEKDNVVPVQRSQEMIDAIKRSGGNPLFTTYPELGHDSWTVTYNNPELYTWMLSQKKMEVARK